jgi:hypothetical protein
MKRLRLCGKDVGRPEIISQPGGIESAKKGDAIRPGTPRTAKMQNLQRSDTKALEVANRWHGR